MCSLADNKPKKSLLCKESYLWYCSWGGCLRKFTADTNTPRRCLLLDLCWAVMAEILIAGYNNHTSCIKVFNRDQDAIILHTHTHTIALCTEGSLQLTAQFNLSCRGLHGSYCKTFTLLHKEKEKKPHKVQRQRKWAGWGRYLSGSERRDECFSPKTHKRSYLAGQRGREGHCFLLAQCWSVMSL